MIDGLWTAVLQTQGPQDNSIEKLQFGVGVMILHNGKVYGGNASNYSYGSYEYDGNEIVIDITMHHYSGDLITILGPIDKQRFYRYRMRGSVIEPVMILEGQPYDRPNMKFEAMLTKRAGEEIL